MIQNCRYAILEHFKSELSQQGDPLLLVLGIDGPHEALQLSIFMLPSASEVLSRIPLPQKEWVLEMLSDLSAPCTTEYSEVRQILHRLCNLGVGPIRTSQQGIVPFEDTESAIRLIKEELAMYGGREDTLRGFESFVPLDATSVATLMAASVS
jgi:hypothetical protein